MPSYCCIFHWVIDIGITSFTWKICRVFGTWPIALLTPNKKKVIIEGPVCDSSQVIGWHLRKLSNESDMRPPIHISSFGFNSSILWDPERWGRPSALQKYSQVCRSNLNPPLNSCALMHYFQHHVCLKYIIETCSTEVTSQCFVLETK